MVLVFVVVKLLEDVAVVLDAVDVIVVVVGRARLVVDLVTVMLTVVEMAASGG